MYVLIFNRRTVKMLKVSMKKIYLQEHKRVLFRLYLHLVQRLRFNILFYYLQCKPVIDNPIMMSPTKSA